MISYHSVVATGPNDPGDQVSVNAWNGGHLPHAIVDVKTGSYTIVSGDQGKIIRSAHSATVPFTLPAASACPDGWMVYISNENTGAGSASALTITRAGSDTIDGVTSITTYPGDLRIVRKSGASAFESLLLRGGYVEFTSTAGQTLVWPSGFSRAVLQMWSGAGGGGSGARAAAGAAAGGGAGGAGGGLVEYEFSGLDATPGASFTVTCGVGGVGGAGRNTDGAGNNGTAGGNTTVTGTLRGISTTLISHGGTAGWGGSSTTGNVPGGNGGGFMQGDYNINAPGSLFGGHGNHANTAAMLGGWGGGAGGPSFPVGTPSAGGRSVRGGPGGGAGASVRADNTFTVAGAGGGYLGAATSQVGGGAAAGTTGAGASGSATPTALGPDVGGGGGGGAASVGAPGGSGGRVAGGGGGAASNGSNNSAAGGSGGDGLVRFRYA